MLRVVLGIIHHSFLAGHTILAPSGAQHLEPPRLGWYSIYYAHLKILLALLISEQRWSNVNMATQQPPADPQPPPPANGTGPPSSGPPSSQLTPAPEPFEPQIAAAKTCLRKQVDATTKTLLQRAEQGTPREISVREIRKDTFTAEQIVSPLRRY